MGVKSDRTVISTYVFGAKMGLVTVFCLPFQKRPMNSFHFCCMDDTYNYAHCEVKKSIPTRLLSGLKDGFSAKWQFCHFYHFSHFWDLTKSSLVTVLSRLSPYPTKLSEQESRGSVRYLAYLMHIPSHVSMMASQSEIVDSIFQAQSGPSGLQGQSQGASVEGPPPAKRSRVANSGTSIWIHFCQTQRKISQWISQSINQSQKLFAKNVSCHW